MKNLIIILFLLSTTLGISQSPNDTIYIDNINIEYLENLILEEINQFRMGYEYQTFEMSEKGRRGCRSWSNKLIIENSYYHNRNFFECLAKTSISDGKYTYGNFSKHIVNMWINSPKHKEGLLIERVGYPYPLYSGVGVAIGDTFKGNTTIKDNQRKRVVVTWRGLLH